MSCFGFVAWKREEEKNKANKTMWLSTSLGKQREDDKTWLSTLLVKKRKRERWLCGIPRIESVIEGKEVGVEVSER